MHVPEDAPWLAESLEELLAFPHGRYDDQVDSTSQALHHMSAYANILRSRREPIQRPQSKFLR